MVMVVVVGYKTQPEEQKQKVFDWHIGETINPALRSADVQSLTADGHELEWINHHFSNIPMHKGRVVTWYGDIAKFIVSALPANKIRADESHKVVFG